MDHIVPSGAARLRQLVAEVNKARKQQGDDPLSTDRVYADAVWDSTLTSTQKITALCYAKYARGKQFPQNDRAWVVYPTLMPQTGIRSRNTIAKVHAELIAAGWLEPVGHKPGHKQVVIYLLAVPAAGFPTSGNRTSEAETGTEISTGTETDTGTDPEPNRYGNLPETGTETETRTSTEPLQEPLQERLDIEQVCAHLADRIAAHGSKRPTITKKWRDAARLLIDQDGRTVEQIHVAIDWSQNNHFWHRNILSMPKLRQHYDRLRLEWKSERARNDRAELATRDASATATSSLSAADGQPLPAGTGNSRAIDAVRIAAHFDALDGDTDPESLNP